MTRRQSFVSLPYSQAIVKARTKGPFFTLISHLDPCSSLLLYSLSDLSPGWPSETHIRSCHTTALNYWVAGSPLTLYKDQMSEQGTKAFISAAPPLISTLAILRCLQFLSVSTVTYLSLCISSLLIFLGNLFFPGPPHLWRFYWPILYFSGLLILRDRNPTQWGFN